MAHTAEKSTTTPNLLEHLEYIGLHDTPDSLAQVLRDRAKENGRGLYYVTDETMRRYVDAWLYKQSVRSGSSLCFGQWGNAVRALRRYLNARPGCRIGEAVEDILKRHQGEALPTNVEFVQLVGWILDGTNPHIQRHIVVRIAECPWAIGWLQNQGQSGKTPFYQIDLGRYAAPFYLEDDLRHIIGGGEVLILTPHEYKRVSQFRRALAEEITNRFAAHGEPTWCSDRYDYTNRIRIGLYVEIPAHLKQLAYNVAIDIADGDDLLAGYLIYLVTDAWPEPSEH